MKVVFLSNYLTAHQIPFCLEMERLLKDGYRFVSTEPISRERLDLGWKDETGYGFEIRAFESPEQAELAGRRIEDADFVLLGAADIGWIEKRLRKNKPVFYVTERYFKTEPRWTRYPRAAASVFYRHNRFLGKNLYLLCAGAFVKSDLDRAHAYYKGAFKWGYFPRLVNYDRETLMKLRGGEVPELLWCGRFLDWKHPEMALKAALFLKSQNVRFHMNIIGSGPMKTELESFLRENALDGAVSLCPSMPADEIRRYMERADIYLATSGRFEGWGSVVNEAMNSGCAVIAGNLIGSVPYLIENGVNGFVFENECQEELNGALLRLIRHPEIRYAAGVKAYETISTAWNAAVAAERLVDVMNAMLAGGEAFFEGGTCSRA